MPHEAVAGAGSPLCSAHEKGFRADEVTVMVSLRGRNSDIGGTGQISCVYAPGVGAGARFRHILVDARHHSAYTHMLRRGDGSMALVAPVLLVLLRY